MATSRPKKPKPGKVDMHVYLSTPVADALRASAVRNKRSVPLQAEYYIERGIEAEKAA